jgi:hypothetical protein
MRTPTFIAAPNANAQIRAFNQSRAVCSQRNVKTALFAQNPTSPIDDSHIVNSKVVIAEIVLCAESGDLHVHCLPEYSEWSPSKFTVHLAPSNQIEKVEIPIKTPQASNQYTKLFKDNQFEKELFKANLQQKVQMVQAKKFVAGGLQIINGVLTIQ